MYCLSKERTSSRHGAATARVGGANAATEGGGKYSCPLVLAFASGTGCTHSQSSICYIMCTRTTGVCRGLQRQSWVVRMQGPCTTRDGEAGMDTAQTVGEDDRKPGWYPYTRQATGIGSSVVPVPCFCFCCCGMYPLTMCVVRGARCEDGRRCCGLNRRLWACVVLAICFLRLRFLKLVD